MSHRASGSYQANAVLDLSIFLDNAWNRAQNFKDRTAENLELVESVITPTNRHSHDLRMKFDQLCQHVDSIPMSLADPRARPLRGLRHFVSRELEATQQASKHYINAFEYFVASCLKYLENDLRKADVDLSSIPGDQRDANVVRMRRYCWDRIRDFRIRLRDAGGIPQFAEFWSAITEMHLEVKDYQRALGNSEEGPSYLELYFGETIHETWLGPGKMPEKYDSYFTDHEDASFG